MRSHREHLRTRIEEQRKKETDVSALWWVLYGSIDLTLVLHRDGATAPLPVQET